MTGRGGFALVITLMITALMSAIAIELARSVYVEISHSRNYRSAQQASLIAESAALGTIKILALQHGRKNYSSLKDAWAKPLHLEDTSGILDVSIVEESGRLNLNSLSLPNGELDPFTLSALTRLGRRYKIGSEVWNALGDWLDNNNQPRSGGAEEPYYLSLKSPLNIRNGPLSTPRELLFVKGVTMEQVRFLLPFITVYSDPPGAPVSVVNINTAPREVLASLDERMDDSLADRIIEERNIKPFSSPADLSRVPGMSAISMGLQGKISVKGNNYRITATAASGEAVRTIETVVRLGGSKPETLFWSEY